MTLGDRYQQWKKDNPDFDEQLFVSDCYEMFYDLNGLPDPNMNKQQRVEWSQDFQLFVKQKALEKMEQ